MFVPIYGSLGVKRLTVYF